MKVRQSIGSRETQEDGHFAYETKDYTIIGIVDGHGGSNVVTDITTNYYIYLSIYLRITDNELNKDTFDRIIKNFYIFLDNVYLARKEKSGCCISVIFYDKKNKKINIVQLGDTKILIFDSSKDLVFQTQEHRLDNYDELNRIMRIEGRKNIKTYSGVTRYKSLMICRVLGDFEQKNINLPRSNDPLSCIPEVTTLDVSDKIFCIFITDGVYDLISLDTIIKIVKTCVFNNVCRLIFNLCENIKGKKDNYTIITKTLPGQ